MTLNRRVAFFVLAATLASGVLAQGKMVAHDDETIFAAVELTLQRARSLAAARIEVHSRDGIVTLRGFAATVEDIANAGRLAAQVRGVVEVRNQIRVADRAWRA